ncbi:MAG TPA: dihydroorotase [Burkholderiaceae bacterium]|nr:dihydroorotase [Burkholderiaceae bacterium]
MQGGGGPEAGRLTIAGGRLVDPATGRDGPADVHCADGFVVGIGEAPPGFTAERVVDARGLVVCPGLVDLSARLREPGFEYKATLESEMQAALAGGVVRLVCPPDTDPPLDEPGLVEMLKHRARSLARTHLYPLGALTVGLKGEVITEMAELAEAGCVGFSQANVPLVDTQVLARAMQYAKSFGFTVWLQPQDGFLSRGGVAHSGPVSGRLGLPGVPVTAETVALHTLFELVRANGCRVHLCRISSAAGVALVRAAKREGLPVTADVAVHHLHVTDVDIGFYDTSCRVDPPFRTQRDRDALGAALADGTLDAVCSDHTPVDDDAKLVPFGEAEPGATGLELLLPLTLSWARRAGVPLLDAVSRLTRDAERIARCGGGSLAPGAPADVCVFDPDEAWVVSAETLLSQGRHTPFARREVQGRVRATVVGGRVAFERPVPVRR